METRDRRWWENRFERLAREVFAYQCAANPVYGRFVRGRGVDPADEVGVDRIPAVPSRSFKDLPLYCGDPATAERVFRTSGTTRRGLSGRHYVRDLSIYRASLLSAAGPKLAIGSHEHKRTNIRVLALIPHPRVKTDSSLAYMVGCWADVWDRSGGRFFADAEWRIDGPGLDRALAEATTEGDPVLVVGTAFSFVHWLDASAGTRPALPEGSIAVETGGFKGRSRTVERNELYGAISGGLGIPQSRIVNEYGMTELLSQFYEPVLEGTGPADPMRRWHVGPPWVRTTVMDPRTLEPVPDGEPGLLCHLDLANLDSVCRVLTEDRGVAVKNGFRLLGRAEGAEPRGCSLAADALRVAASEPSGRESS